MLDVKPHIPQYLHTVDIFDLPEDMIELVRNLSQRDEYRMLDYSDGDYCFAVDLSLAAKDTTSDDDLTAYVEETADAATYPFADWSRFVPIRSELFEYVAWLRLIRYLVANLPADIVETNKLALDVWH
jgi:hypothetical protein